MAQSWLKEEYSSSHSERAGGRAQAHAHAQGQANSHVSFTNMNHASSSSSRDQAAATPTTESQAQVQLPVSTSTTTTFPITDLTTHPSSIPHPTSVNTFNTIDIPYTESSYSSSNVSPASTSTPATPITGAGNTERIATTRSPSVSAAGTSTKTASVASTTSASSDLVAPSAAPPAKAKRVRTSKPKVKTGCANCKFVSPILIPYSLTLVVFGCNGSQNLTFVVTIDKGESNATRLVQLVRNAFEATKPAQATRPLVAVPVRSRRSGSLQSRCQHTMPKHLQALPLLLSTATTISCHVGPIKDQF